MLDINVHIVERLIAQQYPEWSYLEIKPVEESGHDNRTFHLGEQMSVRLPSAEHYVPQVEKEHKWLPFLAKSLTLPISTPLAKGKPNDEYPYPWSVYQWIEGDTLKHQNIDNLHQLAKDLAAFLKELQAINPSGGPLAGKHNFYRGGDISVYDQQSRKAIENNGDIFNANLLLDIWNLALQSAWERDPVWVHGDVAPGNILVKDGKLTAVIDFGVLGVGDPSCDLVMAWTFFDKESRSTFKNMLEVDEGTWNRARGWALWKALITYDEHTDSNKERAAEAYRTIQIILEEYKSKDEA